MKVSLDLHDFSIENNRLDLLLKLKEHFADFKVSLFTIPIDIKMRGQRKDRDLERIHACLPWMQIIPHGLRHNGTEARNWDYRPFIEITMPAIKRAFERD